MRNIIVFIILIVAILLMSSITKSHLHPYMLQSLYTQGSITYDTSISLTYESVALGRLLFYDTLLSGNNRQSCSSCHIQEYGFTDGKMTGIGSEGDVLHRNTMSLQNLAWHNGFFWDGRIKSLQDLIIIPITARNEMNQNLDSLIKELENHTYYPQLFRYIYNEDITINNISESITAFLLSITSFNTKMEVFMYDNPIEYYSNYDDSDEFLEFIKRHKKGRMEKIVNTCGNCHGDIAYGSKKYANNGFADTSKEKGYFLYSNDSNDIGKLKVPTLRNILFTAPYMHDGSISSVEGVLSHYNSLSYKDPSNLSKELLNNRKHVALPKFRKKDFAHLMQMFEYMSDTTYLNNTNYSNPLSNTSMEDYINKFIYYK